MTIIDAQACRITIIKCKVVVLQIEVSNGFYQPVNCQQKLNMMS